MNAHALKANLARGGSCIHCDGVTSRDPVELAATSSREARRALVAWHLTRYGRLVGAIAPGDVVTDYLALARALSGSSSDRAAPRSATVTVRVATAASLLAGGAVDDAAGHLADSEGLTLAGWESWARETQRDGDVGPFATTDDRVALVTAACAELAASLDLRCIRACILGAEGVSWGDIAHDIMGVVHPDTTKVYTLSGVATAMANGDVDLAGRQLACAEPDVPTLTSWYATRRRRVVTA